MKIAILVEGATEMAFKTKLHDFLKSRLEPPMPKLKFIPQEGRIPKEDKLRRVVENLLEKDGYDAVIALTDVYTGTNDFVDAQDAKEKMRSWVGNNPRFYPHAAQYDFEAWLLPFWSTIQQISGGNKSAPSGSPERVNHDNPPSYRIKEIFEQGQKQGKCRSYSKTRDAVSILRRNDLMNAVNVCPELKAFLNTILSLCEADQIP
ncbi:MULTISPECIES: DUF4276 family protein [unclassified Coleofasciculus]|uniref:DUF4276 family protein n=1 Tax=Cyanophyceae TaxID=3028117 RepID=UPI001688ADE4|nr:MULTISPECIES: DUF4276 family protein [unclassified Coleofasciculus]MBD2084228.1 DUF4276 family protein [Coleofasciculus sp. FACHB-542]MBD2540462.1 DUF4276 family protein [Coleofasciculus sp. FACHB-SPT36]